MIIVNDKELEVGDKVKFRCGGESVVLRYGGGDAVYFPDSDDGYYCYKDNGNIHGYKSHLLDIIDIIKKPKPEILTYYTNVYDHGYGYCSYNTLKETTEADVSNIRIATVKTTIDITNNKILSVEIVK